MGNQAGKRRRAAAGSSYYIRLKVKNNATFHSNYLTNINPDIFETIFIQDNKKDDLLWLWMLLAVALLLIILICFLYCLIKYCTPVVQIYPERLETVNRSTLTSAKRTSEITLAEELTGDNALAGDTNNCNNNAEIYDNRSEECHRACRAISALLTSTNIEKLRSEINNATRFSNKYPDRGLPKKLIKI